MLLELLLLPFIIFASSLFVIKGFVFYVLLHTFNKNTTQNKCDLVLASNKSNASVLFKSNGS